MNSSHFLLAWESNPCAEAHRYHVVPAELYRATLFKLMVIYYVEIILFGGIRHYVHYFADLESKLDSESLNTHKD